jgi:hypothetical protein
MGVHLLECVFVWAESGVTSLLALDHPVLHPQTVPYSGLHYPLADNIYQRNFFFHKILF